MQIDMSYVDQTLVNVAFAGINVLGGWVLHTVWASVRDLQEADKELAKDVKSIEVIVAGEYLKRAEFNEALVRIFDKLDAIDSKLDRKADK